MQFCPTCKGVGRTKEKPLEDCIDCDGKGKVTDNQLKFIEYYKGREQDKKSAKALKNESCGVDKL